MLCHLDLCVDLSRETQCHLFPLFGPNCTHRFCWKPKRENESFKGNPKEKVKVLKHVPSCCSVEPRCFQGRHKCHAVSTNFFHQVIFHLCLKWLNPILVQKLSNNLKSCCTSVLWTLCGKLQSRWLPTKM